MRLSKARVRKYRSIRDSGWFQVDEGKTILVGINEAGKSAILQALQQINPPDGIGGFDALRDYPRSEFNDISAGRVKPADVVVVDAKFKLEPGDLAVLPRGFENAMYIVERRLDNSFRDRIENGLELLRFDTALSKDLSRMAAHVDKQFDESEGSTTPSTRLSSITTGWTVGQSIALAEAERLLAWLTDIQGLVDEENTKEDERHSKLIDATILVKDRAKALKTLRSRLPVFVLFNNYFRIRPSIHLKHLADRVDSNSLNDEQYDYGNVCLLKFLGFSPRELSNLGSPRNPDPNDIEENRRFKDQLDNRTYQLNAASIKLTDEIRSVWNPDETKAEASELRVTADGQYLKVVVQDELGVEVELDQRSEGFQWLVSFFIVFFAEAAESHENAILLLDEPGLSLHGLKQREFRKTVDRLAEHNQTLYTTHSPFLVGPDELDLVRVIEMKDRKIGTTVHTTVTADDPASLLPLQEAVGYDMAQSLFANQRNLILEGLTDHWYIDGTSQLLAEAGATSLNGKIALVTAGDAGKVVYYATILHAHSLKVAALLDSDNAGDTAAKQDVLVHRLGNSHILRTKDAYSGLVGKPEVEDLLRETLVTVAKDDLGWDVESIASTQPSRPIAEIFAKEIKSFSKYKLAKAYLRWTRSHQASDLTEDERRQWETLIKKINQVLK